MRLHPRGARVASFAVLFLLVLGSASAADRRGFTAGKFALDIGGVKAGWIMSAEGGSATADVIEEKPGSGNNLVKKHLGNVKYEDIALQLGFSNGKDIYDWIAASWKMNFQRKNGSIVAADFRFQPKSELQFFNALVTETTIPACDASSFEPGFLTVKVTPAATRLVKPSTPLPPPPPPGQVWRPANFRLVIDGLDTSRVSKIESITVKQKVTTDDTGQTRDPGIEPGDLEFPNLTITLSESSAQSWIDWHEDFVIKGNNGDDKERSGTLELLSSNRQTVLARIRFFNMGIVSIGQAKIARNPCQAGCPVDADDIQDVIGKMQAVLYVERMEFEAPSASQ